jgi:hypothetical protein
LYEHLFADKHFPLAQLNIWAKKSVKFAHRVSAIIRECFRFIIFTERATSLVSFAVACVAWQCSHKPFIKILRTIELVSEWPSGDWWGINRLKGLVYGAPPLFCRLYLIDKDTFPRPNIITFFTSSATIFYRDWLNENL